MKGGGNGRKGERIRRSDRWGVRKLVYVLCKLGLLDFHGITGTTGNRSAQLEKILYPVKIL